jgi:hypothetical protein
MIISMERTKVMLAFGRHGFQDGPIEPIPNAGHTRFFRKAIEPFIEENVIKGGRKAAFIIENVSDWAKRNFTWKVDAMMKNLYLFSLTGASASDVKAGAVLSGMNAGEKFEIAVESVAERNFEDKNGRKYFFKESGGGLEIYKHMTSDEFMEILKACEHMMEESERHRASDLKLKDTGTRCNFHWQLDSGSLVRRINRKKPGQITHYLEPPTVTALSADWRSRTLMEQAMASTDHDEAIRLTLRSIDASARSLVQRDIEMVKLVETLREENPARAIMITRGLAHKHMATLFDQEKYELTIAEESELVSTHFIIGAIKGHYNSALKSTFDDQELRAYAQLILDEERFFQRRTIYWLFEKIGYISSATLLGLFFGGRIWGYTTDVWIRAAANHAIAANPEIARELGLLK